MLIEDIQNRNVPDSVGTLVYFAYSLRNFQRCKAVTWGPQRISDVCILVNTLFVVVHRYSTNEHTDSTECGNLGFALAKGLIRGLDNRYPNPSLTNYTY